MCGISSDNNDSLNSELKKIMKGYITRNIIVDLRSDDGGFNHIFDSYNSEDDQEYKPDEDDYDR
jgi:hypothetical protein